MMIEDLNVKQDVVIIPREKATFGMDEYGRWYNESGKLEKRSIIRYLNAAIREDDGGFFVTQYIDDKVEKVYFPYVKTALFAIDLNLKTFPLQLKLNNGTSIDLKPEQLFTEKDSLYQRQRRSCIRLTERSLIKLSRFIEPSQGALVLLIEGQRYEIPSKPLQFD